MSSLHIIPALLVALALAPSVHAQDDEAYMKAYAEATAPGPQHTYLARYAGSWTYVNTMTMPGGSAYTSNGEVQVDTLMGNRYLKAAHVGDIGGMPFEGLSLTAYDRTAGEFVSTWIDNMGLGILTFRGQQEGDDGRLVLKDSYTDPVSGEMQTHRLTQWLSDDDGLWTMEYFIQPEGAPEYKAMTVVSTRRK